MTQSHDVSTKTLSSSWYLVILATKIVSRCRRTLRGEGHSASGWGIGGSVMAADCGVTPKSVHSGNGLPLLALRHLVSLSVSTPLRIVNRCWSCSCKWRYINVDNRLTFLAYNYYYYYYFVFLLFFVFVFVSLLLLLPCVW